MTDIHSHLIWGVDDGAETKEQTFRLLDRAAADGIDRVICTPHITPGIQPFPRERFLEHLEEAREDVQRTDLNLQLEEGAEILYTDSTSRFLREERIPTLAGTRYVLVEFLPDSRLEEIRDALHRVYATGFIPVIAHLERYSALNRTAQVAELRDQVQARVQINARTLIRRQPFLRGRFLDGLFRNHLVDFIATDTHAFPGRESCMTEGMNALERKYGSAVRERILRETEACFGS